MDRTSTQPYAPAAAPASPPAPAPPAVMPTQKVLGIPLALTSYEHTLEWIDAAVAARARTYVCVAAVHTVMASQEDPALRAAVLGADFTVPDGQPLIWAMNALGHDLPSRVYGPDLMDKACARAARTGQRFYLYGGRSQGALVELARMLRLSTPACGSSAATRRRSGRSPTRRTRRSSPTSSAAAPTWSGWASASRARRSGWRGCATGSTPPC